jgi:hypothetical protein
MASPPEYVYLSIAEDIVTTHAGSVSEEIATFVAKAGFGFSDRRSKTKDLIRRQQTAGFYGERTNERTLYVLKRCYREKLGAGRKSETCGNGFQIEQSSGNIWVFSQEKLLLFFIRTAGIHFGG